jgi:hypothetical protein
MPKDLKKDRDTKREQWQQRRDAGLCTVCGETSPLKGKQQCEPCLAYRRKVQVAAQHRWKIRAKAEGLCVTCGDKQDLPGYCCTKCKERRKHRYHMIHRVKRLADHKAAHRKLKIEVFEAYGGAFCACCGEDYLDALSIDHIDRLHGGEARHSKIRKGAGLYGWLRKQGYPSGYRVLCITCNFVIGHFSRCNPKHKGFKTIQLELGLAPN